MHDSASAVCALIQGVQPGVIVAFPGRIQVVAQILQYLVQAPNLDKRGHLQVTPANTRKAETFYPCRKLAVEF